MGLQSPTHITLQKVEVLPNLLEFGPKVILVGTNNLLITPIPKIVNNPYFAQIWHNASYYKQQCRARQVLYKIVYVLYCIL